MASGVLLVQEFSLSIIARFLHVGKTFAKNISRIYMYRNTVQYVALGSRIKVVISNILPASTRNELKFSLKVAFMFLATILKVASFKG